jgi:uncharacterized protein YbbC (DUF1343 family)
MAGVWLKVKIEARFLKTLLSGILSPCIAFDICPMYKNYPLFVLLAGTLQIACGQLPVNPTVESSNEIVIETTESTVTTGAQRVQSYVPSLQGKRVGIVANPTSMIGNVHLVDSLLHLDVKIIKVFAPEHGFRGDAGAGETVKNGVDAITGLPVVSLYGKNKKPTPAMLQDLDVLVFDIQDVGARFYTYLSSLHNVMEACAEEHKELIVLDRPNPNGFYCDGPVLQPAFQSFVGMHPIPVVHGCTLGEMAKMINGEGWLKGGVKCDVEVITCANYNHKTLYQLPVKPSPNLPNMSSVYLYPSLCFFEGTTVSVGRGTDKPFQVVGYPGNSTGQYTFVPNDIQQVAMNPPHEGATCSGHDLTEFGQYHFMSSRQLYLQWLIGLYQAAKDKDNFFSEPGFFDKLAGTDQLRLQIKKGMSEAEIRESWQSDLVRYKEMRKKYLLYEDF